MTLSKSLSSGSTSTIKLDLEKQLFETPTTEAPFSKKMFIAGFFIPIFPWIYTIIAVLGFGLHSKISDLKNRQSRKPFDENKYWAYVCAFALAVELATGSVVAGIIAYHLGYLS